MKLSSTKLKVFGGWIVVLVYNGFFFQSFRVGIYSERT